MENNYPKISVITPSLNSGKYIEEAIQSVLAQNYPNFEHIVMDGGSTDGTIKILKKYKHLKWDSEPDRGQSHAMNKGFCMATGEIIVYLNSDDFFEPNAFHTVVKYLSKKKGIYIVVGECNVIMNDGEIIRNKNIKLSFYEILQWWRYSFPINPCSYFYYRELQEKVGLFDETNHYSMDYDFMLRVSLHYTLFKIDEALGNFRLIKGTKTYETSREDCRIRRAFSRNYWKYLNRKDYLYLRFTYFQFQLKQCKLVRFIKKMIKFVFRSCKLGHY